MDLEMESFHHKRPRCPNWTEQDKIVLVKNIRARRDVLFARNKGDSSAKDGTAAAWQEVLHALNSETHFPRTLEQIKKQHENLKLRAKQLYMDMLQCSGAVKPHILSPAMKLMIDDFKDINNSSPQSLIFEDFSNINPPVYERAWMTQNTSPPLPPPSSSVHSIAGSSVMIEDDDSTTDGSINESLGQNNSININRNSGSFGQNNSINMNGNSDDLNFPITKRLKLEESRTQAPLLKVETERIKAETEKCKAETELIYQRKEYEHAIFELKRKVLAAKLEYYTKENNKKSMSEKAENVKEQE